MQQYTDDNGFHIKYCKNCPQGNYAGKHKTQITTCCLQENQTYFMSFEKNIRKNGIHLGQRICEEKNDFEEVIFWSKILKEVEEQNMHIHDIWSLDKI